MKRSNSRQSLHLDEVKDEPSPTPSPVNQPETPLKKVGKSTSKSPKKPTTSPKKQKMIPDGQPMEWNADGREALIQYLLGEGLKANDKGDLAIKVSKSILHPPHPTFPSTFLRLGS